MTTLQQQILCGTSQTTQANTSRLDQFDILKAFGIILVVIGHSLTPSLLYNFIYSFHMPLFFLVSGYFFKVKEDDVTFVRRQTERLLLPYLFSCFALVLLAFVIYVISTHNWGAQFLLDWLLSILYGNGVIAHTDLHSIGPLWFLLALFWGMLLTHTAIRLKKFCSPTLSILLCTVLALYTAQKQIQFPLSMQQGALGSFYIFSGYLIRKHHPSIILASTYSIIPMGIIWLLSFKTGFLSILQCYLLPEIAALMGAFFGTYFAYLAAYRFSKKTNFIEKAFVSIGRLTLLILCVHAVEDILNSLEDLRYSHAAYYTDTTGIIIVRCVSSQKNPIHKMVI